MALAIFLAEASPMPTPTLNRKSWTTLPAIPHSTVMRLHKDTQAEISTRRFQLSAIRASGIPTSA